ncbi:hypothetical protein DFH09DRAFT_1369050 [Mycena vulgaris]|nr:hypothetical protein DFH09DRAFT_1369050 [Mycena vulgaris]
MHGSLIRRSLGGLVPPKIATPKLVYASPTGTGPLIPLVSFYFALPKVPPSTSAIHRGRGQKHGARNTERNGCGLGGRYIRRGDRGARARDEAG